MKNSIYLVAMTFTMFSNSTFACLAPETLTEELKNKAEIVFVGTPLAYTPASKDRSIPATITFEVKKMIKGPAEKQYKAYWTNGTFGESFNLTELRMMYGANTRVGLINDKTKKPADRPWIVQGPCTTPYMWMEE